MGKITIYFLLCLLLVNIVIAYPKLDGYVTDFPDKLNYNEEKNLSDLIKEIEENTTYEIAAVIVENTEGDSRVLYANHIGDENGVGKAETDNGIVIMWSLDNEEGGAIAVGRGAESILNDAKVARIGRDSRHYFDEGKFYDGFEYIIKEIEKEIKPIENNKQDMPLWVILLILFILIIVIGTIISAATDDDGYSGGRSSSYVGTSYSSGGFSSSGGSSFGSGSFGGGGARF